MIGFPEKEPVSNENIKRNYGLLGQDISYSLSPLMHKSCYHKFDIVADYKLFDLDLKIDNAFDRLKHMASDENLCGFNVTVPYKILVKELLRAEETAVLDRSALLSGAVNTVSIEGESWTGYSTDGPGFYLSLKRDLEVDPEAKNVLVLGAGGAGRSISMYLADLKEKAPESIFVYDLDPVKIDELIKDSESRSFDIIKPVRSENQLEQMLSSGQMALLINATPVGSKSKEISPVRLECLSDKIAVYDLVYSHKTRLVEYAFAKGLKASDGKGMLAYQGAIAFNIWLGKDVDEVSLMMKKAIMAEEL